MSKTKNKKVPFTHELRTKVPEKIARAVEADAARQGLKVTDVLRGLLLERYPEVAEELAATAAMPAPEPCPKCSHLEPAGTFTSSNETAHQRPFRVQLNGTDEYCIDVATLEMARAAACGNPNAKILTLETEP